MTEKILAELEEIAELQFTDREIVIIMDKEEITSALEFDDDLPECPEEEKDAILKAIFRGRLKAEAEVRKAIKTQAIQGSTSAQKQFLDLVESRKLKDETE